MRVEGFRGEFFLFLNGESTNTVEGTIDVFSVVPHPVQDHVFDGAGQGRIFEGFCGVCAGCFLLRSMIGAAQGFGEVSKALYPVFGEDTGDDESVGEVGAVFCGLVFFESFNYCVNSVFVVGGVEIELWFPKNTVPGEMLYVIYPGYDKVGVSASVLGDDFFEGVVYPTSGGVVDEDQVKH